ncbi:MAG: hypothetical protein JJT85_12020 [Chromatiales bacterium]|nr:hypothetical protein [Chromatiales bacterium]
MTPPVELIDLFRPDHSPEPGSLHFDGSSAEGSKPGPGHIDSAQLSSFSGTRVTVPGA